MDKEKLSISLYEKLRACTKEEDRIITEMTKILTDAPDRIKAEKLVLEKLAPLMDEAMRKASDALQEWLSCVSQELDEEFRE